MKVEQNKNTFKPITITLETKDEADYLWHLLNVSIPFEYYGRRDAAIKLEEKVGNEMAEKFSEVYEVH